MTDEELELEKRSIDTLTREECMRLHRFAPAGHLYFRRDHPLAAYFETHFRGLGGIGPSVSKAVGWEP